MARGETTPAESQLTFLGSNVFSLSLSLSLLHTLSFSHSYTLSFSLSLSLCFKSWRPTRKKLNYFKALERLEYNEDTYISNWKPPHAYQDLRLSFYFKNFGFFTGIRTHDPIEKNRCAALNSRGKQLYRELSISQNTHKTWVTSQVFGYAANWKS